MGDDPHVMAILLTCSTVTARQRLAQREIGTAPTRHIERSDLMARKLGTRAPASVHRVATDGRAVAGIAAEIVGLAGWAPGGLPGSGGYGSGDTRTHAPLRRKADHVRIARFALRSPARADHGRPARAAADGSGGRGDHRGRGGGEPRSPAPLDAVGDQGRGGPADSAGPD